MFALLVVPNALFARAFLTQPVSGRFAEQARGRGVALVQVIPGERQHRVAEVVRVERRDIEIIIIAAHRTHHSQIVGRMPCRFGEDADGALGDFVVAYFSQKLPIFEIRNAHPVRVVVGLPGLDHEGDPWVPSQVHDLLRLRLGLEADRAVEQEDDAVGEVLQLGEVVRADGDGATVAAERAQRQLVGAGRSLTIGRDRTNDIVLDDDTRSLRQTVVALKERDYVVLEASLPYWVGRRDELERDIRALSRIYERVLRKVFA